MLFLAKTFAHTKCAKVTSPPIVISKSALHYINIGIGVSVVYMYIYMTDIVLNPVVFPNLRVVRFSSTS